jgi:hypothetical protein
MLLTVEERLRLFEILPQQGNINNMRTVRRLREKLSFDHPEDEQYGLLIGDAVWDTPRREWESEAEYNTRQAVPRAGTQADAGQISWSTSVPQEQGISLDLKEIKIITDGLRRLNELGQLKEYHLELWDKFVGPEKKKKGE